MADSKITDLTELTAVDPDADFVEIVDISATANKKVLAKRLGPAFSGALVRKAADQTAANYTTATAVAWDQEVYDEGGWHDNVTNNSRLTVPSGVTRIRLHASMYVTNNTSNTFMAIFFRKNGSDSYDGASHIIISIAANTSLTANSSPVLAVTAGDYFEVFFQSQSDTSITIDAARSHFAIEAVS